MDDKPCLHCRTPVPPQTGYEIKHPVTLETHDVLCVRCGESATWLMSQRQAAAMADVRDVRRN